MASILQIQEKYAEDNSIKSLEKYVYQPISGTQLNGAGQITIRIENQDAFFYPRRSSIQIEGRLVKAAGDALYDQELISLTNNGLMYLFDNIQYQLSGQEIESIYHPGHATTMLGLMRNTVDYNKGPGLNQCWTLDTADGTAATTNLGFKKRNEYIIKKSAPKGSFRFTVDLESIFGFCEDYDKVMYGFIHTLTLVRNASSDNSIFRPANGVDAGKVIIDSIKWLMPKVDPSDGEKYRLYKTIEAKSTLDVGFRMRQCTSVVLPEVQSYTWRMGVRAIPEQPRVIAIALQTAKADDQSKNIALFDHCQVTNMCIVLNNTRYPAVDFRSDFGKNQYDHHFNNMCEFRRKFYGVDSMVSSIDVDPITYKELFPIYVFDVSKQSERLQGGVVDITVEMTFGAAVPANTRAYAILISDRKMKFQSDGKKMSVIV